MKNSQFPIMSETNQIVQRPLFPKASSTKKEDTTKATTYNMANCTVHMNMHSTSPCWWKWAAFLAVLLAVLMGVLCIIGFSTWLWNWTFGLPGRIFACLSNAIFPQASLEGQLAQAKAELARMKDFERLYNDKVAENDKLFGEKTKLADEKRDVTRKYDDVKKYKGLYEEEVQKNIDLNNKVIELDNTKRELTALQNSYKAVSDKNMDLVTMNRKLEFDKNIAIHNMKVAMKEGLQLRQERDHLKIRWNSCWLSTYIVKDNPYTFAGAGSAILATGGALVMATASGAVQAAAVAGDCEAKSVLMTAGVPVGPA